MRPVSAQLGVRASRAVHALTPKRRSPCRSSKRPSTITLNEMVVRLGEDVDVVISHGGLITDRAYDARRLRD